MEEKTYLFNPFEIKDWSETKIEKQVMELINKYKPEQDGSMYEIAHNIEVLANINYLYGEMIARLTNDLANKKLENDVEEAKGITKERKKWTDASSDKAPAMSYFEALAKENVKEKRKEQYEIQTSQTRFKYAYENMESKMNALKKKMESIKFEEFGGMNG